MCPVARCVPLNVRCPAIAKHREKTTSLNLVRSPSPLLSFALSLSLFFSLDLSVAEAKERRNEDVIGMRSLPLSHSGYSDSPGRGLNNGIAGCKYFPLGFRTAFLSSTAVEGICGSYRLWLGQLLPFFCFLSFFFLSFFLSFFPRVCFPVVRQRSEGQSWGGGWG